ncbi:EAL domain-containing protein [Actinospica durhamensis]|uniref:EAL domain-containing protein n=1 Tax=Actinospica durhamensis TaxID=1508375 RepID=A0A941IRB3_9ACTN|nr:EAL domain-containing protein [Actinospica durhamensis]MBR7832121.1 EAL domain-containing protein [Actinospica durhamensis]
MGIRAGLPLRSTSATVGALLGCAAVLIGCYFAAPQWRALWWALLGAVAVAAVLVGVRRHRPRARAPWLLLAGALAAEAAGDLAYHFSGGHVGGRVPFPSWADAFYLGVYPLAVTGLVGFARRDPPEYSTGTLLDVLIVSTGLAAATWSIFVLPYARLPHLTSFERAILIAYLAADAVLLALALRLPLAGRLRSLPVALLLVGVLGLLSSDAIYGLAQLHPSWTPGLGADLGWAAFFVCIGAAALCPSMKDVGEPPTRRPWALTAPRTWIVLLWCAALIGPALLLLDAGHASRRDEQFLAGYCVVLFGLVFARLVKAMNAWQQTLRRRESEAYFQALVADTSDAIFIAGQDGALRYASPAAVRLLGEVPSGTAISEIFSGEDKPRVAEELAEILGEESTPTAESTGTGTGTETGESALPSSVTVTAADGRPVTAQSRWSDLREDPSVSGIVLTLHDVTEQQRLQDELRRQATTDPLTGLVNRAGLRDLPTSASPDASAPPVGGLILLDLDDFKEVNDTLGHPIGDELLIGVARRLAGSVRPEDAVARLGGDEFAVLLGQGSNEEHEAIARRLIAAFDPTFDTTAGPLRAAASAGLAVTDGEPADLDLLLRNADLALYEAKEEGKHTWKRYRSTLHDAAVNRSELRTALDEALRHGGLAVWYQPSVRLDTALISGFEALVRWPHPTRGLLAPDTFIPLAEQTGQILQIGTQVLRTAVAQGIGWNAESASGCYIGINVSVHQLRDQDFVDAVRDVLADTPIPQGRVVFEITETVLLDQDDVGIAASLHAFRDLGASIALDDFGTGYAALSSLHTLPVDFIKIDKSFTNELRRSARMRRIVQGLITLTGELDIRCVAEGVETLEEHEILRDMGCRAAQGYLYAAAMPAEQATQLWQAGRPMIRDADRQAGPN